MFWSNLHVFIVASKQFYNLLSTFFQEIFTFLCLSKCHFVFIYIQFFQLLSIVVHSKLVCCCSGAPQYVYLEAIIDNVTITSTEQGEYRNDNSHTEIVLEPHLGQKVTLTCLELNNGTVTNPIPEFTFLKNGIPLTGLGRAAQNSYRWPIIVRKHLPQVRCNGQ